MTRIGSSYRLTPARTITSDELDRAVLEEVRA